ncbi:MAG: phospholipase D-like domain-containing protein [Chloroflexota bacterium]
MNSYFYNLLGPYVHMLAALVPLAWISAVNDQDFFRNIGLITICATLGLLPDIDTASSVLGRLMPDISEKIERQFGHRTITHSIGAVFVVWLMAFLLARADSAAITAAYASHLIIDMIVGGQTGIAIFWPIREKIHFAHVEPASRGEFILGIICVVAICIPLALPRIASSAAALIPTQPTIEPTVMPALVPTLVTMRIDNVFEPNSEILIRAGDIVTKGQKIADLKGLRSLLMAETSTPTPTYFLIPTKKPTPTQTPTPTALVQPTQDFSQYQEHVSSAAAALALAEAQGTAAAATIPEATQTAICRGMDTSVISEQIETAHQQIHIAQLRIDKLVAPPPIATVSACQSNLENKRNTLWAGQLARDKKLDELTWQEYQAETAPLLEQERQIAEQAERCIALEGIQHLGSDIEIASAETQKGAAELSLASAQRRYEQATQDHQEMMRRCESLAVWPHKADPETLQVSAARLEVAYVQYQKAINTPTLIPTWTPTNTPTETPTYTPTPTNTPTPDLSDTEVFAAASGDIYQVEMGPFDEGKTSVEVQIATGYGLAERLPGAPGQIRQAHGSIEAFFTKTGVDIQAQLIARVDAAQSSIDVAIFELNLDAVADAVIRAHRRGVKIRIKTDDEFGIEEDHEPGHGQFARMMAAGIEVKDDDRGALMHNKFWIFDQSSVWTGSTNITVNGTRHNNNNVIIFNSSDVADIFQIEFDEMWQGQHGGKSPSTIGRQAVAIEGVEIQVIFGPEDGGIERLVDLVRNAKASIKFMAFSYTHDALGKAMQDAAASLTVQGIFETVGSKTQFSELPRLHCGGLATVRRDGNSRTFHHKVIIIDERIVATGSFNFSKNANDNNDENMVIVQSPEIAQMYLAEFERRWLEAKVSDVVCEY